MYGPTCVTTRLVIEWPAHVMTSNKKTGPRDWLFLALVGLVTYAGVRHVLLPLTR